MYLTDGLAPKAIFDAVGSTLGKTQAQIRGLIFRRGWTQKLRNASEQEQALAFTREREHVERVVKATAAVAEAGMISGLKRALDATESKSDFAARDFRSWAGGSRDLVTIMRQARGLDARPAADGGSLPTVNIFAVGALSFSRPEPVNVTPAPVPQVATTQPA